MKKLVGVLSPKVGAIEETVVVVLLMAMVTVAFLQVVVRKLLPFPVTGLEELARMFQISFSFIGAALGVQRVMHIKIDIMPLIIRKPKIIEWLGRFTDVLGLLFSVVIMAYGWGFLTYAIESSQRSTALNIPYYLPMSTFFIGTALMLFHYLVHLIQGTRAS